MLEWMWRTMGQPPAGMSAVVGALDEFVNPGAHRARELMKAENERVVPTPSPGDRLFDEGVIVIDLQDGR